MTSLRTHVVTVKIADLPVVKSMLADAAVDLSMARQLVMELAELVDVDLMVDGTCRLSARDQDCFFELDQDLGHLLAEWLEVDA